MIVIQAGAILAVLVLYRDRLRSLARGVAGRDAARRRLAIAVAIAFAPAALLGVAVGEVVKEQLFGVGPIAVAWAAGGLVILTVARRPHAGGEQIESLERRQALMIGVAQAAALWPGVSRSLVTIVAATAVGLSMPAAVEFSFLLGFVTLGAATAFEALNTGPEIIQVYGIAAPTAGFAVAFVAAAVSVRWMVDYLGHGTLAVFGYYRLAAAAVAAALLVTAVI